MTGKKINQLNITNKQESSQNVTQKLTISRTLTCYSRTFADTMKQTHSISATSIATDILYASSKQHIRVVYF